MQAQQNFLWLPFGSNRNPVMNLNHIGPKFDIERGRYIGYNSNCGTEYICLPVARVYTDMELITIAHMTNERMPDPSLLIGREWWALHARHADIVAKAIEQYETKFPSEFFTA